MKNYERIYLTHANLKRKLHIVASTIVGYYWSEQNQATHVFCMGQTIFPALEKPEEIDNMLTTLTEEQK